MSVDSIGNFLTIIRNGLMRSKRHILAPYSHMVHNIANILKEEGFLNDVEVIDDVVSKKALKVLLRYVDGESVIHEIERISKLSRRHYEGVSQLRSVIGNLGISVLTTSKGLMTNKKAKQEGIGGEVICTVW